MNSSQASTSSPLTRSSFFDDDDLRITFYFKAPNDIYAKDLKTPALIEGTLTFTSTTPSVNQTGYYSIHNKILTYYKSEGSTKPDSVLNLAQARVTPNTKEGAGAPHSFTLAKNGTSYEVTAPQIQDLEEWIKVLKGVCVFTNFHEEYKATKMIGKGSFAKVYLVEAKSTNKTFAVKAFCKEGVISSNKNSAKPSMINEIDIMRGLDHPNIIKLYEVYETEKSIYLVLELIQGKSLQEVLKRGGFKDNDARSVNAIASILDALAYLSSKGIMHRDLKPDNILLDKGDKVKIVDFGLATQIDVPEYIFKKCGTPGYIAPEVFKYDPKNTATFYDGRCDVFSAGSILYYMLFGRPFFDCSNASEILKANRKFGIDHESLKTIKDEIKHPHSQVSKDGLNLLTCLTEFDQHKRMTALASLDHAYIVATINQRNQGSYNFYQNVGYSPSVHERRGSLMDNDSPNRRSSISTNIPAHRFGEKDSLYLDFGKPELNGRVDTINSSSHNNSLNLGARNDSAGLNSPKSGSPSAFARGTAQPTQASTFARNSVFAGSNNQNVLKAAIHKNIQNNEEERKQDDSGLIAKRLQEVKHDRRRSDFGLPSMQQNKEKYAGYQFDDIDEISQENPQIQVNIAKIGLGMLNKIPSKSGSPESKNSTGSLSHRGYSKGL